MYGITPSIPIVKVNYQRGFVTQLLGVGSDLGWGVLARSEKVEVSALTF